MQSRRRSYAGHAGPDGVGAASVALLPARCSVRHVGVGGEDTQRFGAPSVVQMPIEDFWPAMLCALTLARRLLSRGLLLQGVLSIVASCGRVEASSTETPPAANGNALAGCWLLAAGCCRLRATAPRLICCVKVSLLPLSIFAAIPRPPSPSSLPSSVPACHPALLAVRPSGVDGPPCAANHAQGSFVAEALAVRDSLSGHLPRCGQ
ncbi:hypothetical protein K491DRAFT_75555 [Lophiostoma macrostomum CBS 122681]|uniref:Uncharacterized protein n=1 Tax=Lophiostoma macrostomum CBS 122681 TaxID=1314788 RepID=A0A6A6SW73_9PLEO|nr:hypothetical protein K491DRAFT_75555 [Lophiostoma macrostomum CBS 122681]